MDRRIDLETARATLDEIMTAAADDGARVIVEREGHEPVLVVRLRDAGRHLAETPDWLEAIWAQSERLGRDKLSTEEIDAEIDACRRERRP